MGSNQTKFARELKQEEIERLYKTIQYDEDTGNRCSLGRLVVHYALTGAAESASQRETKALTYWKGLSEQERDSVLRSSSLTSVKFGRDAAMMTFLLKTGLRISEVAALKVGQVSFGGQIVKSFSLEKGQTKGNKSGRVFLNEELREKLKNYLIIYNFRSIPVKEKAGSVVIQRGFKFDSESPLFPSIRGGEDGRLKHLTSIAAANIFKAYFKTAGIPDASSHSFRRTFANRLRRMGVGVAEIQQLLRHAHLNTTMRYLQVDEVELQSAVNNL
tara:strand:- start:65 stop:883 length:819 start_codon:yes stop_codon:yes gene_type:complete